MDWMEDDDLYIAGQIVPPGTYLRVDARDDCRIVLVHSDHLPPSFDGRIAVYKRLDTVARLVRSTSGRVGTGQAWPVRMCSPTPSVELNRFGDSARRNDRPRSQRRHPLPG